MVLGDPVRGGGDCPQPSPGPGIYVMSLYVYPIVMSSTDAGFVVFLPKLVGHWCHVTVYFHVTQENYSK